MSECVCEFVCVCVWVVCCVLDVVHLCVWVSGGEFCLLCVVLCCVCVCEFVWACVCGVCYGWSAA